MAAVRETGKKQDDSTDLDASSIKYTDIVSETCTTSEPKKSVKFVNLTSECQSQAKGVTTSGGSVKLEDDGISSKILAHIMVGR
ncbi:hypothetical protein KIN20_023360 [Parelaphostrongylus tenuis]|uniref:Uncharacterized protein n=1 Tax=Parelaphostrongylus tenuis TaxID=148309 RepID=A0AAD5MRW9_PARTN|nr:hypothetical protein KIN20_023360 [Parelaphostrongylus tenuis]